VASTDCSYTEIFDSDDHLVDNNFGNWTTGTKSGHKFHDLNANGVWDGGELGLPDWRIYVDYDGDALLDPGEPFDDTLGNGSYQIVDIDPGTWTVREVAQAGWVCSHPNPGTPDPIHGAVTSTDCTYTDLFDSNAELLAGDFGNWTTATKSGVKFHDLNANGVDDGEPGLSGWRTYVDYDGNGDWDVTEPYNDTAADGSYTITGIRPGAWTVREEDQTGWTCSYPNPGTADPVTGAVASTDCSYTEIFDSDDDPTGNDFGNWTHITKSGMVWRDYNYSGTRDEIIEGSGIYEPTIPGWYVQLWTYDPSSGLPASFVASDITNENGIYTFPMVVPNVDYLVCEELWDPFWVQTYPTLTTEPPTGEGVQTCPATG
jgi:hypothetical protein